MGEIVEIATKLVSPIEKLLCITKNAAGMLYQPKHIRKMADARAYEIDKISESFRKNSDVLIAYDEGQIKLNSPEFEDFIKRTEYRVLSQELKKQHNIEAVLDNAYKELEFESDVSSEPIDPDWISRLFNIVEDISNEEMQYVWGKILAGEIICPGSFSLRTLDTIRNLSQKEANVFQKILPFVTQGDNDWFITSESSIVEKYGITYEDVLLLDECGLLISNDTVSFIINISKDSIIIHNKKHALLTVGVEDEIRLDFGIYSLTIAGKELLNILDYEPNDAYFNDFSEHIFKTNSKSNFRIQEIKTIDNKKISVDKTIREFCVI